MNTEHEASRTLVKSPPELWAECSDATSLSRHLDQFGEIRITRLEPETAVAWEGEEVSGTVRLEPSGWGTRVIMTARHETTEASAPVVPDERVVDSEPPVQEEPVALSEPPVQEEPVALSEPPVQEAPVALREPRSHEEPPPQDPEPRPQPNPLPPAAQAPPGKLGFFARLRRMFRREAPPSRPEVQVDRAPAAGLSHPVTAAERPDPPDPPEPPEPTEPQEPPDPLDRGEPLQTAKPLEKPEPLEPEPEPALDPRPRAEAALTAALDSLGQAHHRPFSRA